MDKSSIVYNSTGTVTLLLHNSTSKNNSSAWLLAHCLKTYLTTTLSLIECWVFVLDFLTIKCFAGYRQYYSLSKYVVQCCIQLVLLLCCSAYNSTLSLTSLIYMLAPCARYTIYCYNLLHAHQMYFNIYQFWRCYCVTLLQKTTTLHLSVYLISTINPWSLCWVSVHESVELLGLSHISNAPIIHLWVYKNNT